MILIALFQLFIDLFIYFPGPDTKTDLELERLVNVDSTLRTPMSVIGSLIVKHEIPITNSKIVMQLHRILFLYLLFIFIWQCYTSQTIFGQKRRRAFWRMEN